MKQYDVIIVGLGPSGVAAAKVLKDNNINFCVIEKAKFPRNKLCGGGLTHKSIDLLKKIGLSIDNVEYQKCNYVDICSKNISKRIKLTSDLYLTDRIEFDYNNYINVKNCEIFENETIIDIKDNILITNKNKYGFKYIIFADGVNGYSRKFINNRKTGFCVEGSSNKINVNENDKAILDFDITNGGYAWIFPKKRFTTIGFGNFKNQKTDYKELLMNFAKKYDYDIDSDIRGFCIPLYSRKVYKKSVINNRFILVGDAASLVDPISGEGIYYALYSGYNAALSIISCINGKNKNLKRIYFRKNRKIYFLLLNTNKLLNKLLYTKYGYIFIKIGLSNRFFIFILKKLFS